MKLLTGLFLILTALSLLRADDLERLQQGEKAYISALELLDKGDAQAAKEQLKIAEDAYATLAKRPDFANAKLYHNLGNIYLCQGRLGKAICQFRHALSLDPNSEATTANLILARSRRKDDFSQDQSSFSIMKVLCFFHYDISIETRKCLFAITFVLCFALFPLGCLFARHTTVKTVVQIACAVIAIVLAISIWVSYRDNATQYGAITAKIAHAKTGNSNAYPDAFEKPLHDGTEFTVIRQDDSGNWLCVTLDNQQECWLPAQDVELIAP